SRAQQSDPQTIACRPSYSLIGLSIALFSEHLAGNPSKDSKQQPVAEPNAQTVAEPDDEPYAWCDTGYTAADHGVQYATEPNTSSQKEADQQGLAQMPGVHKTAPELAPGPSNDLSGLDEAAPSRKKHTEQTGNQPKAQPSAPAVAQAMAPLAYEQ